MLHAYPKYFCLPVLLSVFPDSNNWLVHPSLTLYYNIGPTSLCSLVYVGVASVDILTLNQCHIPKLNQRPGCNVDSKLISQL